MSILTNTEFSTGFNRALAAFGKFAVSENMGDMYGMRKDCSMVSGERLWLYVFALNTWDNNDIDGNYMTEAQMLSILHKTQINGI